MTTDPNRRDFLKKAAVVTAGASAGVVGGCGRRMARETRSKPNLLFIWTDEQRFDTMAAYGNRKIKTPNLNKLAGESVVFERAYVTQPVCTPSRSSVLTGLWPHQNGCTKNNVPLRPETKCLPELLNDPDYRCAYMGKWHLGDEIFAQHGFAEWVSIEDGYRGHYREGRDRDRRSDYHHFLLEHGYQPGGGNTFSRGFAARRRIEHCKPRFLENRACEFLRRNRHQPFILHINFLEPHMPFFGPLDDLHDPDEIGVPANFHDPLEANEPLRYRLAREHSMRQYGADERTIRQLNARYYGLVSQVDRSVGGILRTLENLGLADNTIVVYTSDHGDMMGAHGLVAKQYMYEESARVPLLLRLPQHRRGQRMITQPVSHIDLVPTLLELMGCREPVNLPGHSLTGLLAGGGMQQDHVFVEWHPNRMFYCRDTKLASKDQIERVAQERTRTVVSPDGWKLCLSDLDKCQLFNLNSDPLETTNLFDSGKHGDVIARLTGKIHQWQESVGDTVKV